MKRQVPPILMADDDEDDRLLAEDALAESGLPNKLFFVENGQQLLEYLRGEGAFKDRGKHPLPGLILLDLNMPIKDGLSALTEIRADERLTHLPVVVLTTSNNDEEVLKSYRIGANSFLTKPIEFDALVEMLRNLGKFWFETAHLPCAKADF